MKINTRVSIPTLQDIVGVTHVEAQVLQILMHKEVATHDMFTDLSNGRVRQIIHILRSKLEPFRVRIFLNWENGYSIPLKDKLRLKTAIDNDFAAALKKMGA